MADASFKSCREFLRAKACAVIPQEVSEWFERPLNPDVGLDVDERTVDVRDEVSYLHVYCRGSS